MLIEKDLFAQLPDNLFRPLAAQGHRLYWRVLSRLYNSLFDDDIAISEYGHSRNNVVDIIEVVLDQSPNLWEPEEDLDDASSRGKANFVYYTLRDSGWLEQERHGYNDYVTMSPRVSQCLSALVELAEGRALVVTGKLKSLQAAMREVKKDPANNADTLVELAKESSRFARNLNSIRGSIKGLYDKIRGDTPAREIVDTFFDDFLREIFIRDYSAIKTTEHPLAIRTELLQMVEALRYREETKAALLSGYHKIYQNEEDTEYQLDKDLSKLEQVFLNIERQLDAIDSMKVRYEKRVDTVIEYATRTPMDISKMILRLIDAINAHPDKLDINLPVVFPERMGEVRFSRPQIPREPPPPRVIQKHEISEELRCRQERERANRLAMQVDQESLQHFLNEQLGRNKTRDLSQISVRNIRDYFCVLQLARLAGSAQRAKREFPKITESYHIQQTKDWIDHRYYKMQNVIITKRQAL